MLPSIYEHWGITLTVIGGGYILVALLCCRLLGFNRSETGEKSETPVGTESSDLPKPFSDSKTAAAAKVETAVRPDCIAKELLYTNDYVQCLTAANESCPHRLGYGQVSFCHHPQRGKIVRQSANSATD